MSEFVTQVNENISLLQDKNGLTYGTDAYLLAAFIKDKKSGYALEIGSGSGIISLLLGKRGKFKKITCLEVQEYFASLTKRNVENNDLSDIIEAVHADCREYSAQVDTVFMNPPYMKTESGKRNEDERKYIARHEVKGDIFDLCRSASRLLKYGGDLYIVYRPDRLPDLICAMRESKIEPKSLCFVHQSVKHPPCLVLVQGKLGGKSGANIIRPLFLTDENGKSTSDCDYIYNNCKWYE